MNTDIKFDFPKKIIAIFEKLNNNDIKAIVVGGYVRDKILNLDSKDIDIELFGVKSLEALELLLKEFGTLNLVGKSFGVYKLNIDGFDLDFTLPRSDNKIGLGHSGFKITIDPNMDFKTASSRRDFTINTIGYDVASQTLFDPYFGLRDLKDKTLRAVDIHTFDEDPLRVLRAVGFSSRFNLQIDNELIELCKKMSQKDTFKELPKERIYEEIKKILLKSPKPSRAFFLFKDLNLLSHFAPLNTLDKVSFEKTLDALDRLTKNLFVDNKHKITLLLAVICYFFTKKDLSKFITNLTNDKKLLKEITLILMYQFKTIYTNSSLLRLAKDVNIENFLLLSQAIHYDINAKVFEDLKKRASNLGVLNTKAMPYLLGRDLLNHGLKASKEFGEILELAYEAQMNLDIKSHKDALQWLKDYLKNR